MSLPCLVSYLKKVLLLIKYLIYFRVGFNQDFLISVGNMVTSTEFIGSGIRFDTSEPNSPKEGN